MSLRSEVIRIFNELIGNGVKITELPAGSAPTGTELIEAVQGGQSVSLTVNQVSSGGVGVTSVVAGTNVTVDNTDPQNPIVSASGGGGGGTWGSITGTLSSQTDLQAALDLKESLYRPFDRKIANYPLVLADASRGIEMNMAGANNVQVPLFSTVAYTPGTLIPIVQYGAGLTSITKENPSIVIHDTAGNLDSPGQYVVMFLRNIAADEWYLWNGTPGGAGSGQVNTVVGSTFIDVDATDPVNPEVALSATGTPSGTTFLRGDNTWATPAGSGDVVGPASATDGVPVLFDGTTGKLVKNSVPTGTGIIPVMSVSPTFTGTPLAPTAAVGTNTTQIATTAYVRANALSLAASVTYPAGNSYQALQQAVGPAANDKALEFLNIGYTGHGASDDIHEDATALVRINGRVIMTRNMAWNGTIWETPIQTASGYGSSCIEAGGEGASLHHTPPGVDFGSYPSMAFLATANGPRGILGFTSGLVCQTTRPLYAHYSSASYNPSGLNSWGPTTSAEPLVHLHLEEVKGSAGSSYLNEVLRIEANGSTYGAINFENTNGSYASKANVTANKITGEIGANAYGGAARRTAVIRFITRGTISGSAAPQSILFVTSPDATANLTNRFEVTNDGLLKSYDSPIRYNSTGISTIPSYSAFTAFSPTTDTSTVGQLQHLSTSTGGMRVYGLGTTSTASTAIALMLTGILGATAPTAPAVVIQALKHNGTTSATDIASTETLAVFRNNTTDLITVLGNGSTTVGTFASAGVRLNATGTIQLVNGGSASVIGSVAGNFTYTDKSWQALSIVLTASPSGAATSAPIIDPNNNKIRFRVRPGSTGALYEFATHSDTLDATTLASTTSGIGIAHTHNPVSGSTDFSAILGTPTLNQTGTFNGSYAFIRYTPILTAVLGPHYGVVINALTRNGFGAGATPSAQLHLGAGTAAASTSPLKLTTGVNLTAAEAGAFEYDNTLYFTQSDSTRRNVVLAASATKTTAGAPYANDGYITLRIGGTDVRFMTTA